MQFLSVSDREASKLRYIKREAVTVSLFIFSVEFQHSHECTLRNFNRTDLPHSLLSLLLLFKQFSLAGNISSITLCSHILADSLHGLTGDNLGSDGCLDCNIELLTRNEFLQFLAHLAAEIIGMVGMDQGGQSIGRVAI